MMLYASEYMKSTYSINVFDDPLTIEWLILVNNKIINNIK